jgi:hypothetical protein
MASQEKVARLAAALRENLRKRKAAAEGLIPAKAGASGKEDQDS